MDKLINKQNQVFTLAADASATIGDTWLIQPEQGVRGSMPGAAAQKTEYAVRPTIRFLIMTGAGRADLGKLRVALAVSEYHPGSLPPVYADTRDVTADFLMNEGSITVQPTHAGMVNAKITVTNRDPAAATLTLVVRITTWSAFAPHRAPAEVQDAAGFGAAGLLDANVGTVLPMVRPMADSTHAAVAIELPDFMVDDFDDEDLAAESLDGPAGWPFPQTLYHVPDDAPAEQHVGPTTSSGEAIPADALTETTDSEHNPNAAPVVVSTETYRG